METKLDELKRIIQEAQDEIARLEREPKKFEFKYEEDNAYIIGSYSVISTSSGYYDDFLEYGRYRKTKESAEDALELNKRINRLHSAVEIIQGNNGGKCYIYSYKGEWTYSINDDECGYPNRVYMERDTAIKICKLLNSGELTL